MYVYRWTLFQPRDETQTVPPGRFGLCVIAEKLIDQPVQLRGTRLFGHIDQFGQPARQFVDGHTP